ncbi:TetR/AcrR family transcriptional regulator [Stackebrandtia nassauensis]|uniref:Transcriptional regulator, TetR family n=1 Tax=Stackebrandtia nassauensis (strain DSM 44728 / CIP 108903 / NRRL B-16338 / NBRC 102104 / LLR-40K-21) TaxID=446470 RepID=D3Q665_STANL|nr:TetR/AcrR family transcriptional regulator [Stackebrandtia nassauensis]ADD42240.1 transcriptional regulator, TetR family [Stackebrandtia nassauensis DSM 44728]
MKPSGPLTSDRILEAAEDVLRRFGPDKTTVVDVARQLGVSHGSVYRHFPSKVALRDAVAERWLDRISRPLADIAARSGPAADRLREWMLRLATAKRELAGSDPELFATYFRLTSESRGVGAAHEEHLARQLSGIIADGVRAGEFTVDDPERSGWAVFRASARFNHPLHAAEWNRPGFEADLADLCDLLLRGLKTEG